MCFITTCFQDIQDDPVQLVSCVDGKLLLHTDRLRTALPGELNDLPLLVVSIIGETGTGKSFLINLMASHLRHQEDRVCIYKHVYTNEICIALS